MDVTALYNLAWRVKDLTMDLYIIDHIIIIIIIINRSSSIDQMCHYNLHIIIIDLYLLFKFREHDIIINDNNKII